MPNGKQQRRREGCVCHDPEFHDCFQERDCIPEPIPDAGECGWDNVQCQKCQQLCLFNDTLGRCGCDCFEGFELHCDEVTCNKKPEPFSAENPGSENCPGGYPWFQVGNYCYLASDKSMTVEESMEFCESQQGTLATIPSWESNFWVGHHFLQNTDVFWIGLSKNLNDQSNSWQWHDKSSSPFRRWFDGHPTNKGEAMCVMANWSFEGEWYSLACEGFKARAACSMLV